MRNLRFPLVALVGLVVCATSTAFADPKIDEEVLGPAGKWPGVAVSQHGEHVAVLLKKGSRFAVSIDGVEGPKIDKMVGLDGQAYFSSMPGAGIRLIPVAFSDDGARSAYYGLIDNEYIVVLDGKELARGKFENSMLTVGQLTFTSGGKHLLYAILGDGGGYQVVVDGQPGPKSHSIPKVVISPVEDHYAYIGTEADGNDTPWTVVDGKQVKYFGGDLQFSSKGHLFALLKRQNEMGLNIDGHTALVANNISQLQISPTGGQIAAMVYNAKDNQTVLWVDGKTVPGTEGMQLVNVYFSPDDKHYAALANAQPNGKCVFLDGKKGQRYDDINAGMGYMMNSDYIGRAWAHGTPAGTEMMIEQATPTFPCWSADSSKFLYVGQTSGQQFLVTNTDESDGYQSIAPVISPDGNHFGYITNGSGQSAPTVVLDGKTIKIKSGPVTASGGPSCLTFSPDSTHYVIVVNGTIYLDGVEVPDVVCTTAQIIFSPDSQHVLVNGASSKDPSRNGIFLDGKLVATDLHNPIHPAFSADGKHVFWLGNGAPETSTDYDTVVLYVDGKPANPRFHAIGVDIRCPWEISADGVLTFVAQSGDELKRYHVTPDAGTSTATMLAGADTGGKKN